MGRCKFKLLHQQRRRICVRLNSKVGDGTITYPQTDETLVAQPSVFTMDKNTIKFDSNEITFDRT